MTAHTTVGALEGALDKEHRAVYAYGLVAAHLVGDALTDAQDGLVAHANRRDTVTRLLRDAGGRARPPEPAYRPTAPVRKADDASRLAIDIEDACAAAYTAVLSVARPRDVRRSATGWLRDAAVRSMRWRLRLDTAEVLAAAPLPGLDIARADTVQPTPTGGTTR